MTLDNQIDTTTGTIKGRASFDNRDDALFPNQFVNTRLLVNTLQHATLIPDSTIQHNGPVAFVYVIQNGVANERKIQPSFSNAGMTAVEGLQPGDVVVNSSFDKLENKAKVNVVNKPAMASTRGNEAQ
jgi:multidrug efflux system membrane fusion protein